MPKGSSAKLWLILLTLLSSMKGFCASNSLELESRYEGDGWFRYTITLPTHHFATSFEINYFVVHFGSVQEMEAPEGWVTIPSSGEAIWNPVTSLTRPSVHVFRCRSPYRHFRMDPLGIYLGITTPHPEYGIPVQATGIIYCLVPCPPEYADGSEPVFTAKSQNPDLKITNLLHDTVKVTGISLNLQTSATYVLEASSDLAEWREATTFQAPSGTASFTSLNESGPFFRVRVGETVLSSAALSATSSRAARIEPSIKTSLVMEDGKLAAVFPSQKDTSYTVEFLSYSGQLFKKLAVTGTAPQTTVPIPVELRSSALLLRVYATQLNTK
ncbi:MAG TPA: hypothetical protein VGH19_23240 [Verrucomicrobiae bacterium]